MGKPILCLDFDGVIHSYTSGWKGAHVIPDPPVPGAIPYLLNSLDHFTVAIFSSRSRNPLGRFAMKRWLGKAIADHWETGGHEPSLAECECWGDAAGIWQRFSWPWFKPAAVMTIDDRALTFDGDWSSSRYSAEAIRAFKPWNKQPKSRPETPPQCLATVDIDTEAGFICDQCQAKWLCADEFACLRKAEGW
jgi:hypothetical protein